MRCLLGLKRFLLCSLVVCGLTGCPGPGRQPTAWVDSFASNGASRDEIRKAFLECGASVPGDIVEYLTPDGKMFSELGANEFIFVVKCMDRSGFSNGSYIPCRGWTENGKQIPNNLPACQPDAVIPKRTVQNRLNSAYCKTYPETRLCQPVVVSEAEWNETHKEEIAARRRLLEEVKRQGYSTSVGTAEARYCREEAKRNAPKEDAKSYFEKCLKDKFKVWNPFLSFE